MQNQQTILELNIIIGIIGLFYFWLHPLNCPMC